MDDFYNDYIKDISDNAVGYGVSFLRAYLKEDLFSPEHSYHLHYLFSYDKNNDHLNVICLDNLSNIVISDYQKTAAKEDAVDNAMFEISKDFVENIYLGIKTNSLLRENAFCRADQRLWDKFNDIKETLFIDSMKDFSPSKSIIESKEIPFPDFKYKYLAEDKYVNLEKAA